MDRTGVGSSPAHTRVGPQRGRLSRATSAVRAALDGGAPGADLRSAVAELAGAWREHVEFTEAPEGLFDEMLGTSTDISPEIDHLRRDHVSVTASLERVDGLLSRGTDGDDTRVRDTLAAVLKSVGQHRKRGAGLLYDLYSVDPTGGG